MLDENLSSAKTLQRFAICGLGGCGKTALALEYAYRVRAKRPNCAVFWAPAITRESFEKVYLDIGILLQIPGIEEGDADVKRLVRTRLSDEEFGEWLLIVDNADDEDVLFRAAGDGTSTSRLVDCLPHSRRGSVLFTTRSRIAAVRQAESNILDLGVLTREEAKVLLQKQLVPIRQLTDDRAVDEFLELMAHLALAIVQAVAYMNANSTDISKYVDLYKETEESTKDLLGRRFEDSSRYVETNEPVARTWFISFEQIRKKDSLAAEYMSFMGCVARENIPRSLLPPGSSNLRQNDAIGTLAAYAFVTKRQQSGQSNRGEVGDEEALDVHRLVHLTIQDWLKLHGLWIPCVVRAAERLEKAIPFGGHENRKTWTAYLPHAIHTASIPALFDSQVQDALLDKIGQCQHSLGDYKTAISTYERILSQRKRKWGMEHRVTLCSMNIVASVLSVQGQYVEAEKMHRETLALREKVLGTEHPNTLLSMNSVAFVLGRQGQYAEAEKMLRETLALQEKILGKEHPDTLLSMSIVAVLLSEQSQHAEAEKICRETLALREKVLGREHPLTLVSVKDLARILRAWGKHVEAAIFDS